MSVRQLNLMVLPMMLTATLTAAAAADERAAAQVLAGPCAGCHGPDGHSPGAMPSIAGRPEAELLARMTSVRDGTADATVMTRLMKGYDEAQIATLAHWFAEVGQ